MIKYAKILNEVTKQCAVGIGVNKEFYKSLGYTTLDVEQAYDDGWYLMGYAPKQPDEEIIKEYENAVQSHIDHTANEKGYDSSYTCLSYLNSKDEKWRTEANIFLDWRDSVWLKTHEILNDFKDGKIEQPTIAQVIEQLPKIEW